ncbi:nucleotidyltransferase domain-containing protein [Anoxybacillus flavithermus]|uniref:Nucleotidyltransferase domain-containing protein n=1 Tax=Anoxybacillus flavithermus TaxID=33934 RepID=A0A2G5RM51_9BACL|nr:MULTISPECIES: nucleotidyltransferase domain-containing protein [Anoxybacillus]KFZ42641.1 DNA polymerase subunit beta [Anoxybacillus sp. KU2-6(11)]PIC03825.1 nucleotidyltransferase domain-containing protein [Anoxybacillus flavithermus]
MEQIIVETLKNAVSPSVIYLFGSVAAGHIRYDSDIDIAFLSDERSLDHYERFMLAQQLAEQLQRDVDLIDLKQASTVFQAQIVSSGKVIYCADEQKRAEYERLVLKMYAKLNEERAEILRNIAESGSVYDE